jgi:hypothetical protein
MFVRSDEGLGSQHLFYDADYVLYCEGEAVQGEGASFDEMFWQIILSAYGIRVFCKSVGSKTTVKDLALLVVSNQVPNVIIAMDRDYDHLQGAIIYWPTVLYTYGYSWESDVVSELNFNSTLALFVVAKDRKKLQEEFNDFLDQKATVLRRLVAIDFKYIGHNEALFNRTKPMSILHAPGNSEPRFKIAEILASACKLGGYQTGKIPATVYAGLEGFRDFYGKAISRLVYHWFVFRTKKIYGCRKVIYDTFMSVAVNSFDVSTHGITRNDYYRQMIARL